MILDEKMRSFPLTMPDGKPWPKISIVTPSYNQGRFLEETIRSVLLQNYPNLEYIIMDGGSTDHSVEIIRRYESQIAYWESAKDNGQSHAINKGFALATGDVLAYLNSDDAYTPGTLMKVGNIFSNAPHCVFLYGRSVPIDADSAIKDQQRFITQKTLDRGFRPNLLRYCINYLPQPSCFWRRCVYEAIGGMDESMHLIMDYDYWLRVMNAGFRIQYVQEDLSFFRYHRDARTPSSDLTMRFKEMKLCCRKNGVPPASHVAYYFLERYIIGRFQTWSTIHRSAGWYGLFCYWRSRLDTRIRKV